MAALTIINNQAMFTPNMITEIQSRLTSGPYKTTTPTDFGDFDYIASEAAAFDLDPQSDPYDNYFTSTAAIPNSSIYAPVSSLGARDHIFHAGLYAFFTNDVPLAQKVIDRIIQYAHDDNLDFSNGTTKTNVTHGTFRRFVDDNTAVNPWLFVSVWMYKLIKIYALTNLLGVTISAGDRDRLDQWFIDCKDFMVSKTDVAMIVTHSSGWRIEDYNTTAYNQVLAPNSSRTNPAFTDQFGTLISPTVTLGQQSGPNNTKTSWNAYIHTFGVYFEDQPSLDFAFDYLKSYLYFNIFSNCETAEMVRSYAGQEMLGIKYAWTAIGEMVDCAHTDFIAEKNGFPLITDGSKWYDFETSLGTDDFAGFSTYVGTSTSGGPKGIKNILLAQAKYHQQFSGTGWSPQRYYAGTTSINMATVMRHRPAAAMANIYYQDQALADLYNMNVSEGYETAKHEATGAESFNWPNSSAGGQGLFFGTGFWAEMESVIEPSTVSTLEGQCLFTEAQRVYLRDNRFNQTTGKYISTDFGGNGFFGDVNGVVSLSYYGVIPGAEQFLNQEQATSYADQWTFASTLEPVPVSGALESTAPYGENSTTGQYGIDHIHYAAILAYVWQDDQTSVTFSGETKTRALHAFDLAEAVFNVIVEQSNDTKLDFSNRTKYPIDIDGDGFFGSADIGAPLMYYIAKMEKYLHSHSLVAPLLQGETYFEAEVTGVETWLADAAEFAYLKTQWQNNRYIATEDPTATPFGNRGFDQQHPSYQYLHYTSGGTGQTSINNVAQGVVNNIALDFVHMYQSYGILFNNTAYKTLAFDMFQLAIKMGSFSDGSWFEFSRATSGDPSLGFNYAGKSISHLASMAYKHGIAAHNGIVGVSNPGQYFTYSTSEGSDELYTSGWSTSTTSGGTKSLLAIIANYGKWFRTTANGGYSDIRYARTGLDMQAETRPYVLGAAIANTYYNDNELYELYNQDVSAGYAGPAYYTGISGVVENDGPYRQWTLGNMWGRGGAMFGGFGLVGDMETRVFIGIDQSAPIVNTLVVSQIRDDSFLVTLNANEETSLELEYGTSTGVYDRAIPPINIFATTQQYRVGDSIKLIQDTTYYWRIKLEDAVGNIRYDVEQTTTTLEKLPRNNRPHKFGNTRLGAGYIGPIKAIK